MRIHHLKGQHWRLPNSARNLAEAEFGKSGRISNLPKPKFGATLLLNKNFSYKRLSFFQHLLFLINIEQSV